ncbi:lysophospholipid acyltransferase family protein [Actinocorallia lasiicapitis]
MRSPTAWTPPPRPLFAAFEAALAPVRALTSPVFHGVENLPTRGPALLVGNHTTMPLLDVPVMMSEIRRQTGVWIRSLADHVHFVMPGWRELLHLGGCVDGTRENCRAILAAGETVLVFPGGAREVAKRRGEKYQLLWDDRTGFARMAIEAGCPIIPFGAVGVEDQFPLLVDPASVMQAPLRFVSRKVFRGRRDLVPAVLGIDPRPERLYFAFGEPIETDPYDGRSDDVLALSEVRDTTRKAVEGLLDGLLAEQAVDPGRRPWGRLLGG